MTSPYEGLPDRAFWRRAVSEAADLDPVGDPPFTITRDDRIATAGSCFAQHLSRALVQRGYRYLVTEPDPTVDGQAPFPARFGNIYTARQLLQLFDRAYGLFRPRDSAWAHGEALVDPFRPRAGEFESPAALVEARSEHLARVREMFEDCDVFVFTLGLTESWLRARDGAVFPLAPGVAGGEAGPDYVFHNMSPDEIAEDLAAFFIKLRVVNPDVRIILTVSPVPLIATYAPRHVLVSNTYSKAALRVAVEIACARDPALAYFPSYEVVTAGGYFANDRRTVTEAGVARVMELFARHFLAVDRPAKPAPPRPAAAVAISPDEALRFAEQAAVICDEEAMDPA